VQCSLRVSDPISRLSRQSVNIISCIGVHGKSVAEIHEGDAGDMVCMSAQRDQPRSAQRDGSEWRSVGLASNFTTLQDDTLYSGDPP
jgi:hypothetical protein